jgi:hypothetical protein
MDSFIRDFLVGIAGNLATTLGLYVGNRYYFKEDKLSKRITKNTDLQSLLRGAIQKFTGSFSWIGRADDIERMKGFLLSPDVDSFLHKIYLNKLTPEKILKPNSDHPNFSNAKFLGTIRDEFITCLASYMRKTEEAIRTPGSYLFSAIVACCEKAIEDGVADNLLSAHEARSDFRFQILFSEMNAVKSYLNFFRGEGRASVDDILSFEHKYRQEVGNRHRYITPPHFHMAQKVPIEKLYVSPLLISDYSRYNAAHFAKNIYRTVLLGNPGGGKTSLTQYIICNASFFYTQRRVSGRLLTPILVTLREYAAYRKSNPCSILEFIELDAKSYQINPPKGSFEYLLLNGRALVIFDGMDELLDTSFRKKVSESIESFCRQYPSVPVLVTSRYVGYEQAPLDPKTFSVYELTEFNEDQVISYAKKWFPLDSDFTKTQSEQKAEGFIKESEHVLDLRRNPLMLALMCNLYRGDTYLPKNRPAVYERCSHLLFEKWDRARAICVQLPFEEHIRPTVQFLAYSIYNNVTLQQGVEEETLVEQAIKYLYPRCFQDQAAAKNAAEAFILFCRDRAWVFSDAGTTAEGSRLYKFTHRTFLEYFTAAYLASIYETTEDLAKSLLPKIKKQEWDIPAQLAFQIKSKSIQDAADKIIHILLSSMHIETNVDTQWSILSFAFRCLEFIVPGQKTTSELLVECINYFSRLYRKRCSGETLNERLISINEFIKSLMSAASDNRDTIYTVIKETLVDNINNGKPIVADSSFEILCHFKILTYGQKHIGTGGTQTWQGICNDILNECNESLKTYSKVSFDICNILCWLNKISGRNIIEWHGVEALFSVRKFILNPKRIGQPFIMKLLPMIVWFEYYDFTTEEDISLFNKFLAEIGDKFLVTNWEFKSTTQDLDKFEPTFSRSEHMLTNEKKREFQPNPDTLFGILAVLFTLTDIWKISVPVDEDYNGFWKIVEPFLIAYGKQDLINVLVDEMDEYGFNDKQIKFIAGWLKKDIAFKPYLL